MFDDRNAAAEAPKGLRQFETDISPTQYYEMRGNTIELECLDVCHRLCRRQTSDVRHCRMRSKVKKYAVGRHDPCATILELNANRPGRHETALSHNELHPVRVKGIQNRNIEGSDHLGACAGEPE